MSETTRRRLDEQKWQNQENPKETRAIQREKQQQEQRERDSQQNKNPKK